MIIDLQIFDILTKLFLFLFQNLHYIILKYITEKNREFSRRGYLLVIEYKIGAVMAKIANRDCNIIMKTV